jgi:hypothetical protein
MMKWNESLNEKIVMYLNEWWNEFYKTIIDYIHNIKITDYLNKN